MFDVCAGVGLEGGLEGGLGGDGVVRDVEDDVRSQSFEDEVGGCGCWRRWTRAEALFSTSHVHDYLGLCMSSGTCRGFAYATSRLIGFLSGKSGIAFWVHCIVTTPSGPFQIPILS